MGIDDQTVDDAVTEAEAAADKHRNACLRVCIKCAKKAVPAGLVGLLFAGIVVLAALRGERAPEMILIGLIATVLFIWAVSIGPRHQSRLEGRALAVVKRAQRNGELDYPEQSSSSRTDDGRVATATAATTAAVAAVVM